MCMWCAWPHLRTLIHVIYDSFDFVWIMCAVCPCSPSWASSSLADMHTSFRVIVIALAYHRALPFLFIALLFVRFCQKFARIKPPKNFDTVHIECSRFFLWLFHHLFVRSNRYQPKVSFTKNWNEKTKPNPQIYTNICVIICFGNFVRRFFFLHFSCRLSVCCLCLLSVCFAFGVIFFLSEKLCENCTPPTDVKKKPSDNWMK